MKIRLIGLRNNLGIGRHYTCFADAIKRVNGIGNLVEEINFQDSAQLNSAVQQSQPGDINISFVPMNIHEHFCGHNVQWTVFESTRIPSLLMKVLPHADSVWVPSGWGQQTLITHGIDPARVAVVPEGVDTDQFHPYARPSNLGRPFRFLFVGKYEQRKSCNEVIQAFAQAFGNNPMVELVIKTNYFVGYGLTQQDLEKYIQDQGLTNVQVFWGEADNLVDFYRNCDVFVLPSKGEGWGLPIIEAAASGMPIVSTFYSGHREYLQHITSGTVPVDYKLGTIECPEYHRFYPEPSNNWGLWAIPDVDHLAECLRFAKNHWDFLAPNALKNSRVIRTEFSWANSVNSALKTLQNQGLLSG
jgi:glycosyltransferase involved in cell wall biosynthesis